MTTSLSSGLLIREILSEDIGVTRLATDIFPIVTDKATLPYVSYQRTGLDVNPTKYNGAADTVTMEVTAWGATYDQAITLAEAVREALHMKQSRGCGLDMRSCILQNSDEGWEADAFFVRLFLTIKIN